MTSFLNILISCLACISFLIRGTELHHRFITPTERTSKIIEWKKSEVIPFQEILISWSGQRPTKGAYIISMSIYHHQKWSPWFPYAYWGCAEQHLYNLQANKDITAILNSTKATGFRIRVEAEEHANLKSFRALHVSLTDLSQHQLSSALPLHSSRVLAVPPVSQIALNHSDSTRICSPTSTAAVASYLASVPINPLIFAEQVRESFSKIYGVWVLNTAQAAHALGAPWCCYVSRCKNLQQVVDQLNKNRPVVVSIQGPIPGGARPYEGGHLLVIRGYDAINKKVLCMDPAFPEDDETYVAYDVNDFLTAWKRRQGLAYMFRLVLK